MYLGFVALEADIIVPALTKDTLGQPATPAALPTYRVYGPTGLMNNGTGSLALTDAAVTGLYSVNLPVNASNGYSTGQTYVVLILCQVAGNAWGEIHTFTAV
jgi:hypothetical protein